MTDLPRYLPQLFEDYFQGMVAHPDGEFYKVADVSARLQQLEESEQAAARVRDAAVKRCEMLDTAEKANESLRTQVQQLEQEKANLHADCHDMVCNGNPAYPRGAKGVGCSCRGRENRAAKMEVASELRIAHLEAALAETRAALHHLQTKYVKLDQLVRMTIDMAGTDDVGYEQFKAMDALATSLGYEVP